MLSLCCSAPAFSSCGEWGLFPGCGAQALGHACSVGVVHRLSSSAAHRIFPDQGSNPCVLHWQAIFSAEPPGKPWFCFLIGHMDVPFSSKYWWHVAIFSRGANSLWFKSTSRVLASWSGRVDAKGRVSTVSWCPWPKGRSLLPAEQWEQAGRAGGRCGWPVRVGSAKAWPSVGALWLLHLWLHC